MFTPPAGKTRRRARRLGVSCEGAKAKSTDIGYRVAAAFVRRNLQPAPFNEISKQELIERFTRVVKKPPSALVLNVLLLESGLDVVIKSDSSVVLRHVGWIDKKVERPSHLQSFPHPHATQSMLSPLNPLPSSEHHTTQAVAPLADLQAALLAPFPTASAPSAPRSSSTTSHSCSASNSYTTTLSLPTPFPPSPPLPSSSSSFSTPFSCVRRPVTPPPAATAPHAVMKPHCAAASKPIEKPMKKMRDRDGEALSGSESDSDGRNTRRRRAGVVCE